jgi:hypothetical protein
VYNDVKNAKSFAAVLAAFPANSVRKVVLAGHGTHVEYVGIQPTNNNTADGDYGYIDSNTLSTLTAAEQGAVRSVLEAGALFDIQSCGGYTKIDATGVVQNYVAQDKVQAVKLAKEFQCSVRYAIGRMSTFNVAPESVKYNGVVYQSDWPIVTPSTPAP